MKQIKVLGSGCRTCEITANFLSWATMISVLTFQY